jgi:hypothetical protein
MQANEALATLATKSVKEQQEMLSLLAEQQQQLAMQSTDSIQQFNTTFTALQIKTRQTDRQLSEKLGHADISDPIRRLLARRKIVQEQIIQLLKEAVPRARNAKSLLASEMQSLKAGRRALNGYKNGYDRQGTIINRVR